jgi:hypothetical protein
MSTPTVTFGITSTGNIQALLMCLSSVVLQTHKPEKILLRMEGEYPAFGNFYLEQLVALARIHNIEVSITTAKSQGIRYARDWLIDNCMSQLLWMGDDDCVYGADCLAELLVGYAEAESQFLSRDIVEGNTPLEERSFLGYVNGNKADVNNRRGYEDFQLQFKEGAAAQNHDGYNYFFSRPGKTVLCGTADTGNLLINLCAIRLFGVRFQVFSEAFNSSGDDTLFALMCHKYNCLGFFRTSADAYHLEKPQDVRKNFSEFAARKNMLLRECELLNLPKDHLVSMLPWLKTKK